MRKIKSHLGGAIILILAAIFGFIFPSMAKWILLGLVLLGLENYVTGVKNGN